MEKEEIKILVVDDSELARKSIKDILEQEGYNVVASVGNAEDAMQASLEFSPNTYIIDVIMPEISGLELAESISSNFSDTNIIMMSSLNNESLCIEAISSGANDFLVKPFNKSDLILAIEKLAWDVEKERAG